jgi:ubiquinone/menaquinone biosynthesis C-methylase UbiE
MILSESERKAFGEFEKCGWDKTADPYHHHFGALTQQSSEALLDAARVQAGSKVLDVATGPGYVAASAHKRGADAIGIDFSPAQVDLARQNYPGVEFQQGDAEDLPFKSGLFDAVVMGLCLLHLPSAERGVAEAFRVLKPGGHFAATVWARPEDNPAFRIILSAIERHGTKVDLPPSPPFFRFADAEEVARVLLAAGFVEPQTQLVPQYWRLASPDDMFVAFTEGTVRSAAILRAQPEQTYQMIRLAVREEVLAFAQGGRFVIPAPVALSSATKPLS